MIKDGGGMGTWFVYLFVLTPYSSQKKKKHNVESKNTVEKTTYY